MQPDLAGISREIDAQGMDGLLLDAPGTDPDQRYLTGFPGPDPFVSLLTGGELHLLVRGLDRGLAEKEGRGDTVATPADFDRSALVEELGPSEADNRVLARFLEEHDVSSVLVPPRFPLVKADGLRTHSITVTADREGVVEGARATKTTDEVDAIRATQRATERALRRAAELLAAADVEDGTLLFEDEPLTSERVKAEIAISLVRDGCEPSDTIVAGGRDAGNPHDRGSGPLPAGDPIVIDIFPADRESGYHADLTRTFCVGEPSDIVAEWYDLTARAQDAALDTIRPGISSTDVHDAVCEVYEEAGITTLRTDATADTGFTHGTGHGVGLDVHERPRVSTQGEELRPGHVITIEPGVYDPEIGGVRIEDLVVVTEDGYENLTAYDRELRV